MSAVSEAKRITPLLSLVFSVMSSACAQTSKNEEPPAAAHDKHPLTLPGALLGTFAPYSENFRRLGDLTIRGEVLSWGRCQNVRYRLFKKSERAYYLEQDVEPACGFRNRSSYLVLVPSDHGL